MFARRHSYIPASRPRQSRRAVGGVAAAVVALSLERMRRPRAALRRGTDLEQRGAHDRQHQADAGQRQPRRRRHASDWEAIRHAVAATAAESGVDRLPWRNPQTGSAGTIASLSAARAQGKLTCRSFATTINDQRGVRRYRGEACRHGDGGWQLYGMVAEDARAFLTVGA